MVLPRKRRDMNNEYAGRPAYTGRQELPTILSGSYSDSRTKMSHPIEFLDSHRN